tara:strand:+ start:14758 stop:15912 length:1155 start_codon:yes stop_codon:yes gene_type:complete
MECHGIIEGEDVYYCDICGIYQTHPLEEEALLAAEKKNCGCGQDPCITFGAEVDCPPATQDVKINARNQKQAFDKFGYGPRNVKKPEDYWKKMAEFWEVSVEKAKEQNCGNCVAYDVSPRMKDCGVGENLGYCWMHNFQCQSARTCKTWAKGGPIKTDKESVEWQKRALGDVEKQAENTEKKPEKDHNCISCGHHSAHLKMGDDKFCYDCYHYAETFNSDYSIMIDGEEYDADYEDEGGYHGDDELDRYVEEYYGDDYNWVLLGQHQGYDIHEILPNFVVYDDDKNEHKGIAIVFEAETFNSYKVAPELSSYTVDELVDSIAGPQGSASYDEMVYDPIAQDRLSAESISVPHTVLLLGGIVAGLGFGVFLTKKLGDKTSDKGGA